MVTLRVMDDDQSIYSVECTDEANTPTMLCMSGFKALEDGASYVVYRGSPMPAVEISPSPVVRTMSEDQQVVRVMEENDVVSFEESLTYEP